MRRTGRRSAVSGLILALGLGAALLPARMATREPETPLAFRGQPDGTLEFDTGLLRGRLHASGQSLGLTEVTYVPRGLRLDKDAGLLGYYRLFSGSRRFLPDARAFPSQGRVLPDGRAEVTWEPAEERPFGLRATYRLVDAATIELETTVVAREALAAFEVFQANYCSAAFSTSRLYCRGEQAGGDGFVAAAPELGPWVMAPRDAEAARQVRDGRWKLEPNPVDWALLREFALPMALRRDPASGVSLLFMTRPEECLAVSTPQEKDAHFSAYFSLFGGALAAGESRQTVSRLVVADDLTDKDAVETVHAFLRGTQPARGQDPRGAKEKRVLIVTGQDYPGHLWKQTTPALRSGLERDSRLSISVTEDPALLDSSALDGYDAVVLHFMNWEQPAPGAAARARLRKRVSEGMGLMLVHFACGAFQDWPQFEELAGRVWDPKLRGHDPYGSFEVVVSDRDHPITKGLGNFRTVDELYTCLAGVGPIHVVASARSAVDGKDYPMAFVLQSGRGRVFHSVLGHDAQSLRNPGVSALLRRGCAWVAGLSPEAPPR